MSTKHTPRTPTTDPASTRNLEALGLLTPQETAPIPPPDATKEIIYLDPKNLSVHRSLDKLPALASDSPEFISIVTSVQEIGIQEPLKIVLNAESDDTGIIIDGRHRWRAAKRLGLTAVPCIVIQYQDSKQVALASLTCRRHYTKAQLVYVCIDLMEDAFVEASERMFSGTGNPANSVRRVEKGLEMWADELGVSRRYLEQVRELRKLFEDKAKRDLRSDKDDESQIDTTFREFWEPRILRSENPLGIGGVLTAIKQVLSIEKKADAGIEHTGGAPQEHEAQLDLFTRSWEAVGKKFRYWSDWDQTTRLTAIRQMTPVVAEMPDDLLEATAAEIKAELKRRAAELK